MGIFCDAQFAFITTFVVEEEGTLATIPVNSEGPL